MGLAIGSATKLCHYTYGLHVNRMLGRPQGCIKELWIWDSRKTHPAKNPVVADVRCDILPVRR